MINEIQLNQEETVELILTDVTYIKRDKKLYKIQLFKQGGR